MTGDPVRIAQFWQAVEIFSPQSLPTIDPKNHTVDLQRRDRVPWDQHSRLPEEEPGCVWRHEVYGGLYELRRVRDVLVARYGQDREEEPPPKGKSALFVLIPWDGCPSACWSDVPLIAIAARDSRAASKSSATDFRISWPRAALSLLRF